MDPNHLKPYDPEHPERSNVMDIDLSEEAMPPTSAAASWPWAQSLVAPVSLDSGPMDQQQIVSNTGISTDPGTNPFPMPGHNYNRLETPIFHPFATGPGSGPGTTSSSPSKDLPPPPPPAHTAPPHPHSHAQPPPFGVTPLHPHPSRPAKVAIPRSASNGSHKYRRHRSARACEPCRNRKIKCDGNKPVCRQCVEQKITCTFLDVKRVREQKQLGVLARKVERYEEVLRELEPDVDIAAAKRIRKALKVCFMHLGELVRVG